MDSQCITVKEAIDALSNPQNTKIANEWLMQFEKSSEAWGVSERMLHETNPTYGFFGAKFLYSKIQKQALLLTEVQKNELQQTLCDHIVRIASQQRNDSQLLKYLCLCLSALALQVNDKMVVQNTLNKLNPLVGVHSMTLVTFLSVLPEEVYNGQIDVGASIRDAFLIQLSNSSNDVLKFLSSLWGPNNSSVERCKMIKCLSNWIDITTIPITEVTHHQIYLDCVSSLGVSMDDLLDHSIDLLLVLIRRYQSHHMDDIVHILIPQIISLKNRWDLLESQYGKFNADDIDESFALEAYALSKLFTEASEYCIEIFLDMTRDYGQQTLLYLLIHCCNYPFDHNVARTPHKFFYDLSLLLKGGDFDGDSQLRAFYNSIYSELLLVAVNQLEFSSNEPNKDDSRFEERNDWREVVLDCQDVMGADGCFQVLCYHLQSALNSGQILWLKVEALLFSLTVIVPKISDQTASSSIGDLIRLCCTSPKEIFQLRVTCISLLGSLSGWIKGNHDLGKQLFDVLISCATEDKIAVPSSIAILSTCRCGGAWIDVEMIVQKLDMMGQIGTLPREVELNLTESACCGINFLEQSHQTDLCGKLILGIQNILSQSLSTSNVKTIVQCLDKLAVISKVTSSVTLLTTIFNHMWPVLQLTFGQIMKESIAEKLCKCLKHFIRGCKEEIAWVLPSLTEHLSKGFSAYGYSAFLYCAGICVSTFGVLQQGKYHHILYTLVWSLSSSFFIKFSDMLSFEQQPDIVEEYFYMVSKLLQFCPYQFLNSQQEATSIINAAIVGLQIHHRQAQKGMLCFLERFCQLPRLYGDSPENLQNSRLMIQAFSSKIIQSVMILLSGRATAFSIDEANGCICDLLWELRKQIGNQSFEVRDCCLRLTN